MVKDEFSVAFKDTPWVAWTCVLITLLFGVSVIMHITRLIPYSTAWGDIGTWAQAVLTGGGLIFAGLSIRAASLREDRRLGETRDVARRGLLLRSRWIERHFPPEESGGLLYQYEVVNSSMVPVTNCKLHLHSYEEDSASYDMDKDQVFYQAVVIGALGPGEIARGEVVITNPRAANTLWRSERVSNPDMTFTDAWGRHWRRPGTSGLRPQQEDLSDAGPHCMCCGELPASISYRS